MSLKIIFIFVETGRKREKGTLTGTDLSSYISFRHKFDTHTL
jgi:hypothetical protein